MLLCDKLGSALFHLRNALVNRELAGHNQGVLLVYDGLDFVHAFTDGPFQGDGAGNQSAQAGFVGGKPSAEAITLATSSLT